MGRSVSSISSDSGDTSLKKGKASVRAPASVDRWCLSRISLGGGGGGGGRGRDPETPACATCVQLRAKIACVRGGLLYEFSRRELF